MPVKSILSGMNKMNRNKSAMFRKKSDIVNQMKSANKSKHKSAHKSSHKKRTIGKGKIGLGKFKSY